MRCWKRYSFAISHILTVVGILVGAFFANQVITVANNFSVSANAEVDIFKTAVEDDLSRILKQVQADGLAACNETWKDGVYTLEIDGKAGYYPGLEYNVEFSQVALSVSKAIQRLLARMEQLNELVPSSLSADATTIGWADTARPRRTNKYVGNTARCLVTGQNDLKSVVILNQSQDIGDNMQLACARAADFNRSAGIESTFGSSARLLGRVSEDANTDGSSRGVTFRISIFGFSGAEVPINLCPTFD